MGAMAAHAAVGEENVAYSRKLPLNWWTLKAALF